MNRKTYDPSSLPEDIEDPKEKETLHQLAQSFDTKIQDKIKGQDMKIRQHRMEIREKEFVKILIAFNKDLKYIIYLGLNDGEFDGKSFMDDVKAQKLVEDNSASALAEMGIDPSVLKYLAST